MPSLLLRATLPNRENNSKSVLSTHRTFSRRALHWKMGPHVFLRCEFCLLHYFIVQNAVSLSGKLIRSESCSARSTSTHRALPDESNLNTNNHTGHSFDYREVSSAFVSCASHLPSYNAGTHRQLYTATAISADTNNACFCVLLIP